MGREDEIAAITPADVTEFVGRIVDDAVEGEYTMIRIYPTAEARKLGMAKRALDAMIAWKPDSKRAGDLQNCADMIGGIIKAAVIDAPPGTVIYRLTARDIEQLRPAVHALVEYEVIKAADTRRVGRGRR